MKSVLNKINAARVSCGFLTIEDMLDALDGNQVLDPFSTLVSKDVTLGRNNVIYPGVTLSAGAGARIILADDNVLHAGSHFEASAGRITIGSGNQFGEGGFTAKANRQGADIHIGSFGRYLNNPGVFGKCRFGDGTQVLGNIVVDSCVLGEGGSYLDEDPDHRGGLLKGSGTARDLTVPQGMVIADNGTFRQDDLLPQRHFHPKT